MIPLYDEKSAATKPALVTIGLIILNSLIFIAIYVSGEFEDVILQYGVVPANVLSGSHYASLIIHMFLHGNFLHIISNMWFLWIFGDNVEYNFGKLRYIIFYITVGIVAMLTQVFLSTGPDVDMPMVGASGAISGIIGAYVVLYPKNKIRTLFIFYYPIFVAVPAYFYVIVWFLLQILYISSITNVAYLAHLGGFAAGIILVFLFRNKSNIL